MAFKLIRVLVALGIVTASITPVGARTYGQVFRPLRRLSSNSTNNTNSSSNNSSPSPTPTPAPAPSTTKVTPAAGTKVVKVDVTIRGLDYQQLKADSALEAKVKSALEDAMAKAAGVPAANVNAVLSAGSVKASFTITPPTGSPTLTVESISKKVKDTKTSTASSLISAIKAVEGYDKAVSGSLSAEIADPVTTTTTSGGNVDGAHRCAASGVGAALLLAMATIAVASPAR